MDRIPFTQCFFWLMIYSFLGWCYESALCSVAQRKLINRGFLNGPVCPVYGFGAITAILLLSDAAGRPWVVFFAGMMLTSVLEYFTSWAMEKLFHARWWDYSERKFQLNGRICLEGALIFGLLSVWIVCRVHPALERLVSRVITPAQLYVISGGMMAIFGADLVLTVRHVLNLNGRLKELQQAIDQFKAQRPQRKRYLVQRLSESSARLSQRTGQLRDTFRQRFEQSEFYSPRVRKLLEELRFQDKRLAKAFPKLKHLDYHQAWEQLRDKIGKK